MRILDFGQLKYIPIILYNLGFFANTNRYELASTWRCSRGVSVAERIKIPLDSEKGVKGQERVILNKRNETLLLKVDPSSKQCKFNVLDIIRALNDIIIG